MNNGMMENRQGHDTIGHFFRAVPLPIDDSSSLSLLFRCKC